MLTFIRPILLLLICLLAPGSVLNNHNAATAFVSPVVVQVATQQQQQLFTSDSALFAAKKVAKAKKIQVRLLKNVQGTGQKGEVVQVTPAFFQNKLQRTQSAEIISDEEVEQMQSDKAAAEQEEREHATAIQEKLKDKTIRIQKKAGPDGQLFGGIGAKALVEELQTQIQDDFFQHKGVKIVALLDENGKKLRSDIKHTGEFGAKVSLSKDISAEFKISVEAEE